MFTVVVISAVMVNIQKFSFLTVFCEKTMVLDSISSCF